MTLAQNLVPVRFGSGGETSCAEISAEHLDDTAHSDIHGDEPARSAGTDPQANPQRLGRYRPPVTRAMCRVFLPSAVQEPIQWARDHRRPAQEAVDSFSSCACSSALNRTARLRSSRLS